MQLLKDMDRIAGRPVSEEMTKSWNGTWVQRIMKLEDRKRPSYNQDDHGVWLSYIYIAVLIFLSTENFCNR